MSPGDTATEPRDLVRRWFEDLFSEGELDTADEILASDINYRGPPSVSPTDVSGPSDMKEYVEVYRTAFPDLRYTIDEIVQTDGQLSVRWTAVGTQEGDLLGIESTGESFSVEGVSLFVTEDGAITDVYAQWDTLKMVQELGSGVAADSTQA